MGRGRPNTMITKSVNQMFMYIMVAGDKGVRRNDLLDRYNFTKRYVNMCVKFLKERGWVQEDDRYKQDRRYIITDEGMSEGIAYFNQMRIKEKRSQRVNHDVISDIARRLTIADRL